MRGSVKSQIKPAIDCLNTEKITYRVSPKSNQTVIAEFFTRDMPFKVAINVHFVEGFRRFTCYLTRTESRLNADVTSGSSPIEYIYDGKKTARTIFAYFDFDSPCTVNLTMKFEKLEKKQKKKINETSEPQTRKSFYRPDMLISDLERMRGFIKDKTEGVVRGVVFRSYRTQIGDPRSCRTLNLRRNISLPE